MSKDIWLISFLFLAMVHGVALQNSPSSKNFRRVSERTSSTPKFSPNHVTRCPFQTTVPSFPPLGQEEEEKYSKNTSDNKNMLLKNSVYHEHLLHEVSFFLLSMNGTVYSCQFIAKANKLIAFSSLLNLNL